MTYPVHDDAYSVAQAIAQALANGSGGLTQSQIQALIDGSIQSEALTPGNNLSDVLDKSAARTALGIGTAGNYNYEDFDPNGAASTARLAAITAAATDATTKANSAQAAAITAAAAAVTARTDIPFLVAGKISSGYLPSQITGVVHIVANDAAKLALTGVTVGDGATQSDTGHLYKLTALPASTEANWLDITAGVLSIHTAAGGPVSGNVTLVAADVGADPAGTINVPSQTGHAGQFWGTNGSSNGWMAVPGGGDVLVAHGTVAGAVSVDYSAGDWHTMSLSAAASITIANWPASGSVGGLVLQIQSNGHAVTLPTGWQWMNKTLPTFAAGNGTDQIVASTVDGGTTVLASQGPNYGVPQLAYLATLLSLNPWSLLTLDEATGTYADASGNSRIGTQVGTATRGANALVPTDATGKSVTLDGTTGYVTQASGPQASTTGAFSIVFTIEGADPGSAAQSRVYTAVSSSASKCLFQIASSTTSGSSNKLGFLMRDDSNLSFTPTSALSGVCLDGTPHEVVFVYNNGAVAWYVDGALSTSASGTPTAGLFAPNFWNIGALYRGVSASGFLAATLDDFTLFSRALTSGEVATLHSAWTG